MIKKNNNQKGLTLVETLVSILIFGFISVVLVNLFVVSIKTQTRIIESQKIFEDASYAINYMSDKARMAIMDVSGDCVGAPNASYGIEDSNIRFLFYDSISESYTCREFYLEGGMIKERISSDNTSANFNPGVPITSSTIGVNKLGFYADGQIDVKQPRVTILINMSKNTSKVSLQTTISKRELEI